MRWQRIVLAILILDLVLTLLQRWQPRILAVETGGKSTATRHVPSTYFLYVLTVHRLVVVLLVQFLLRYAARVVEETLGKGLVLPLDPLVLALPHRNVQRPGPHRITLAGEGEVAI